jgi:hypothetical protein
MGKQPVAAQKKSKDSISKAAQQAKGGAKVIHRLFRNGLREKSKKKPTMPSSSIRPPTTASSPPSPNSESTSAPLASSKNSRLSAPSPAFFSARLLKPAPSDQLTLTANRPSSPLSPRPCPLQLWLRPRRLEPRRRRPPRRNDVLCDVDSNEKE